MTSGPYINSNASAANRTFSKIRERLSDMSVRTFLSLNCEGKFEQVGNPSDSWTASELDRAVERSTALATDPAKGNKITDGGIEEAAVALTAEHLRVFEMVTRESSGGAEFIDEKQIAWDVKSPLSPPVNQNWQFSPSHQLEKVRHDFSQGDRVLFNLSRVNSKDRDDVLQLFSQELTCDERGQIVILTEPEVLSASN